MMKLNFLTNQSLLFSGCMDMSINIDKASLLIAYILTLFMLSISTNAEEQLKASQLKLIKVTCYTCHGNSGDPSPPIPALDGLDRERISQRLYSYKTGEAPATVMSRIAKALTDNEIEQISSMFSGSQR